MARKRSEITIMVDIIILSSSVYNLFCGGLSGSDLGRRSKTSGDAEREVLV
jgi:hypothetical protein